MIAARYASLIAFAQSRGFCPTGEGGGIDNSCGGDRLSVSQKEIKDAWGKESYELEGETLKNFSYTLEDKQTGGLASLKVSAYHDYSDGDFSPKATEVNIVSWHATPLSEIAAHGLAAEEGFKGKGFGRAVMKEALRIADEHKATVLSIFAPSDDSQAVMKHYTETGLLEPILSSKAVYGDYFTSFKINKEKAAEFAKRKPSKRAFCPNGEGNGVTNTCGKGIGINDADQDFTGQILAGEKTIETRRPNSLKPYIGKTVGIVRTGKGKATLVGVMKIGEPKFYKTRKEFDADFDKHKVGKDSPHYIGPEGKYGYPLSEVKPVKPRVLSSQGRVARVIAKSVKTRELTIEFDLGGESPEHPHESRADAPAPEKDQIKGSDVNKEGSAKNKSGDISLNESIVASLKSKADEHNDAMRKANKPSWTHVSLPALKAVYRRGAGAFSTSHRPGMTRDRWALARVNAFLTLARRGRPENAKYTTDNDLLHSDHPKHSKESRSADCGREDDGKFGSGNKCAGSVDMPKEDPKGRMRYDNGVQTDAARKLYQMGSSEKKLKSLVDSMGGDPKNTRVDINPPSLNISVADKDGNKLFHVDLENGRARLYPAKDLTKSEASKIKEAAGEAFGGRQSDHTIKVFSKAEDMKKWEKENAAKIKKWEDKYAFSTLLPPHQRPKKWERSLDAKHASLLAFVQSRGFCPNGEGNGVTNTCSSKDSSAPEPEADEPPPALHLLAERDAEAPQTKMKSGDGEVTVVDRTGISTPDYLDEIECHGRNCGLEVTFQLAKQLQPNSEIEDDWSPLDAYVGPGSGYFTGYDGSLGESADSSIDYHGGDYGTIDDYTASDLLAEKQKEVEKEWDDMSDDEKNVASMKLVHGIDESPPDDEDVIALRESGKKQWMDDNTSDIEESINAMRDEARQNAVKKMAKELESAVAGDTIECCLQLYRGMNVDTTTVEEMISDGYVVHEGVNSWTTSRGTARSFGANRLLIVTRKPRVGHIFASNAHDEKEVIRPPSRMRILGVVRTSTGTVLHVDEDEDYKGA
jgi:GNAT superfamily N-acetyltransferase